MAVNLQPQNIPPKEKNTGLNFNELKTKLSSKIFGVPLKEKLFFVQHLSIMLKAGISLSSAIKTLSTQSSNKLFAKILTEISGNVEKGVSFTESLRPHEKIFGELFINMIEAGELSGKLEEVLKKLFIQIKKQHELISKVKGALTYPAVIIFAMGGIGIFMMIFVIPKITEMLTSFDVKLPLPTRVLIFISTNLVNHGLIVLGVVIIALSLLIKFLNTEKGRFLFHNILINLPIIAPIIKMINLAQFSRTISSLLKTDIAIIKCFQITSNVLGNVQYRVALTDMSESIKKGGQINEVIKQYPKLFPPTVTQMISVGEQTGELDTILEELAEFYENEVDQIMSNLPAIIEPILILILGVAIGGMAASIVMPMYSITEGI